MGSRGASSGKQSRFKGAGGKPQPQAKTYSTYKGGAKAQQSFINHVKEQTNVDISKARETKFDTRNGFNIDTKQLTPNEYNALKSVIRKVNQNKSYQVTMSENGATRMFIKVKKGE